MTEFNKEDIELLNFIVEKCLSTGFSVTADNLVESGHINLVDEKGYGTLTPKFDATKEFVRLMHILDQHGVCECSFSEDAEFARSNSFTFQFQRQGGFKKVFNDLKEKRKQERIELRKAKVDLELAEKMLKEYPKTKWIARISFLIGIIALIVSIIQLLSKP